MGTRLLRGRGLAAAGVLAAGVVSGCQSHVHFLHPGVARGERMGTRPTTEAVTGTAVGRPAPVNPATSGMAVSGEFVHPVMNAAMPTGPGTEGAPADAGATVTPAGFTPGTAMSVQTASVPPMPVQSMTVQPASAVPPYMPATAIHGIPVTMTTGTPTMPAPGTPSTPTLMLIQGPNGPQYVITEVYSVVPLPTPGAPQPPMMLMPAPMPTPAPAAPTPPPAPMAMAAPSAPAPMVVAPSAPVIPASAPMPELAPAPPVAPVAIPPAEPATPVTPAPPPTPAPIPDPVPPAAPTFSAPPPATIPPPSPTGGVGMKSPDPLPRTVSMKPAGGDSAVTTAGGPKLPPAGAAIDDDIPAAPVFLPVAK